MYMIINELKEILEKSWIKQICVLNQSAETSLIVNDFLGGKIRRCMCETGNHYYNLINGHIVDLTAYQFKIIPNYTLGEEIIRDYLLFNEDTKNRYLLLLKNVKENFIKYGKKEYKLLDANGQYFSKVPGTLGGNKKLKIYGKLDCSSALRWIDKGKYIKTRVFFENEEKAREAGYRPCGICMKKEYKIWKNK